MPFATLSTKTFEEAIQGVPGFLEDLHSRPCNTH
jgi:hypothetical protein